MDEALERRIIDWASGQPDIRAIVLIGSMVRRDPPADAQSDVDLVLYVIDPKRYIDPGWRTALGVPLIGVLERWFDGTPEHLVLYADGPKIDLAFRRYAELQHEVAMGVLHSAYQRGYRVLVDKDELAARLPPTAPFPPILPPPSMATFAETVERFWFWALRSAQVIWRDEGWVAQARLWTLRSILLPVLESEATARGVDAWHSGRFLARWADPETLADVQASFGGYSAPELWQALGAMTRLFHRVARRVAERYGYPYPAELEAAITARIAALRPS